MVYGGVSLGLQIAKGLDDLLARDGVKSLVDVAGVESKNVAVMA